MARRHCLLPTLLVALVSLLASTGCITSSAVRSVTWTIEEELPGLDLKQDVHLRLGRVSLGLARMIIRLDDSGTDQEEARLLRRLRSVEVGVYTVNGDADHRTLSTLGRCEKRLADRGRSRAAPVWIESVSDNHPAAGCDCSGVRAGPQLPAASPTLIRPLP